MFFSVLFFSLDVLLQFNLNRFLKKGSIMFKKILIGMLRLLFCGMSVGNTFAQLSARLVSPQEILQNGGQWPISVTPVLSNNRIDLFPVQAV